MNRKVQRAIALTKTRGLGWLLRSILAELPLLPHVFITLARLVSSPRLPRFLMSMAGIHTNQAWAERAGKLREVTKLFVKSKPVEVLEIGSWFGQGSTATFFDVLPAGSKVVLVDSWRPYSTKTDQSGAPSASAKKMDCVPHIAINSTLERIYQLEKTGRIAATLMRSSSEHGLPMLQDKSFDVIYIDGSHYYDAVKRDIQQAKRLIKDEGLICGDDLDLPPSDELLAIAAQHLDEDLILLEQGKAVHPGVVVAIAEEFEQVNWHEGFWWIYVRNGEPLLRRPETTSVHQKARATAASCR